ncbi:MAG TPA: cupin domain-containing protein [Abditibacterium sp.]|jgi:mannose-6-phosphate isomerase-like protein (cupin superfamily)
MIENQTAFEASIAPSSNTGTIKIMRPGEGEIMELFGERVRAVLSCLDTGGQLALHEVETPEGAGPPLHIHREEDEIFIVQSGRYEFQIGSQCLEAEAGTVVFSPRQVPHTFCNIGEESGRLLILSLSNGCEPLPGGCERFFQRCSQEFATGAPRASVISRIGEDCGISFPAPSD